jgi:hypothetical protein
MVSSGAIRTVPLIDRISDFADSVVSFDFAADKPSAQLKIPILVPEAPRGLGSGFSTRLDTGENQAQIQRQ